MTEQDKMDVIHALKDLGFVQGAAALWVQEKCWVRLESDPFFPDQEACFIEKEDINTAHISIKTTEGTENILQVTRLESPHTAKNKIDVLIDDIKNNPTPVKEAWVMELEQIKVWCDANDTIKERRANQLVLFNEANAAERRAVSENLKFSVLAPLLRTMAKSFDDPKKLTTAIDVNQLERSIIGLDQKDKLTLIADKIDEVIGRGALYYDELRGLLEQLRKL